MAYLMISRLASSRQENIAMNRMNDFSQNMRHIVSVRMKEKR